MTMRRMRWRCCILLCDGYVIMDEIDQANERAEIENDRQIAAIRAAAAEIPEERPGECESCGLESKRLVNDLCAPCRDMRF